MKEDDFNEYIPSLLNPRAVRKENGDISLTQNSVTSRCSLSLRKNNRISQCRTGGQPRIKALPTNKENYQNLNNLIQNAVNTTNTNNISKAKDLSLTKCSLDNKKVNTNESLDFLANEDIASVNLNSNSNSVIFTNFEQWRDVSKTNAVKSKKNNESLISISSATELDGGSDTKSEKTVVYEVNKPTVTVSFGVSNCTFVDVCTNNSNIKRIQVSHKNNDTNIDCDIVENSELSVTSDEKNMSEDAPSSTKKLVAVNIDIKKKKTDDRTEGSKVLILNTNAIGKLSHVIVQPPNYKLVKRKILDQSKIKSSSKRKSVYRSPVKNGKTVCSDNIKQKHIEVYFPKANVLNTIRVGEEKTVVENADDDDYGSDLDRDDTRDMSKNSSFADGVNRSARASKSRKDNDSPRSYRVSTVRTDVYSSGRQDIKTSSSDAHRIKSPTSKNDSISLHSNSPRKKYESLQFSLPAKSKINKPPVTTRNIPHYKIVAGTHFAVDAFAYGEIPNVKHYFLTHFHSDHYTGLKKSFNKELYCSKITANLCITRLGVSPNCIHVLNPDETVRVEGVEVTAVDANHCPGALMLLFTLPNGKNLLHCGDFRACPAMESYPIFWNKDIHTVYLDTTYCNPRYDFPTQDQSLEMALYLLRQKKLAVEKAGKKFSSVLIVCGTYTIGKEKFFLGMARRVDCSVWAFPEKDRILQAVEGRSFSQTSPQSCQLHVLAMRDLTYEKLKTYLESLQGAFSEVVAFKPSGWENGKNSPIEKDNVTIYGIPYSEHSSFSELIRFVKFLKPKQVVPTVGISGGIKAVQKYFPCPLICKEENQLQSKLTDFFCAQNRQQVTAVT